AAAVHVGLVAVPHAVVARGGRAGAAQAQPGGAVGGDAAAPAGAALRARPAAVHVRLAAVLHLVVAARCLAPAGAVADVAVDREAAHAALAVARRGADARVGA